MLNSEELIEKLFEYYRVSNVSELSRVINSSQAVISNWKIRNSVSAIKKKCRELGIYNDIFGDLNTQTISSNNGQIAQNVSGNQTFNPKSSKKENDVDDATYGLFLESYKKALKNDDLKGLRVHLMDY